MSQSVSLTDRSATLPATPDRARMNLVFVTVMLGMLLGAGPDDRLHGAADHRRRPWAAPDT
jgi:hypothetical protein